MEILRICRSLAAFSLGVWAPVIVVAASESNPAVDEGLARLEVGAGAIESYETDTLAMVFARYHFPWEWNGIRFWAEISLIDGGSFWMGGGLRYDVRLNEDWRIGLASGPGYFHESDELDLGHEVEFYSSIELVRKVGKTSSVAAGIGHLSNAGLGDFNPGANTCRLSFRWQH